MGSVALSCPLYLHSKICGFRRRSTMSLAHQSYTASASEKSAIVSFQTRQPSFHTLFAFAGLSVERGFFHAVRHLSVQCFSDVSLTRAGLRGLCGSVPHLWSGLKYSLGKPT